jgi:hypothetical protein
LVSGALVGVFAILTKGWWTGRRRRLGVVARGAVRLGGGRVAGTPISRPPSGRLDDGVAADDDGHRTGVASALGVVVLGETLRPGEAGWIT